MTEPEKQNYENEAGFGIIYGDRYVNIYWCPIKCPLIEDRDILLLMTTLIVLVMAESNNDGCW